MDRNSNAFTILFATSLCVVLAVCLAATYNGLKGRMDSNAEFDRQKNVLLAMGLYEKSDTKKTRADLEKMFQDRVVAEVLEVTRGEVEEEVRRGGKTFVEKVERVTDVTKTEHAVTKLDDLNKGAGDKPRFVPLYRGVDEGGETIAWCIPISGYGLWSTLYGYLALDKDLNEVRGITFFKHGETPGLGGEVDNVAWQQSWRGKKILDEGGKLVGVALKKGIVDAKVPAERDHMVDGLSGATITSNGVTRFVLSDLETYDPYFKKYRK